MTSLEAIDALDDTLFTPNFDSLIIAHEKQEAIKIFENKISFAWDNFPKQLKFLWTVDTDTRNALRFKFGDGSASSISVATSGRSGTYHRVHISEFAKICKEHPGEAKEIIEGTLPAVPISGRVDIESTAEGDEGTFRNMFWEAWGREPTRAVEYKAHFYNWTWDDEELAKVIPEEVPIEFKEYQLKHKLSAREITYYFHKWLSLNKDWNTLHQEYPTTPEEAFVSAGDKFFDYEKLSKLEARDGEKVGDWTYYAEYTPGHRYAVAADPSEGVGRNNSAVIVWDFDARKSGVHKPGIVASFISNKIPPDRLAYEIRNAAVRYGNCIVAPERNNHGHATIAILKQIYPNNLYYEQRGEYLLDKRTEKIGWHTNSSSKPKMMYDLKTIIDEELIDVPDERLIRELRSYPGKDLDEMKFDEDKESHWDLVMAMAIGWQMKNFAMPGLNFDKELQQAQDVEDSIFNSFDL